MPVVKAKFSVRFLLLSTLVFALCIHFRYDIIGYPPPAVQEFSPRLLRELSKKTEVWVIASNQYFLGWENFILENEEIRKHCLKGEMILLRAVYWPSNEGPNHYNFFFQQLGHHKEPIVAVYRTGEPVKFMQLLDLREKEVLGRLVNKVNRGHAP